jgi:hypothetical protein
VNPDRHGYALANFKVCRIRQAASDPFARILVVCLFISAPAEAREATAWRGGKRLAVRVLKQGEL